ncbi:hypothetical protein KIL84_016746 [Mauremys mutica]|uniref:Uncharacterized protein n=1 Tax=Mauremys mutica TaxID=74926 RepID=A0A9D3X529_9SAUR|nr:hypothetical protein KIL84_016746 [Mauremys mutica]
MYSPTILLLKCHRTCWASTGCLRAPSLRSRSNRLRKLLPFHNWLMDTKRQSFCILNFHITHTVLITLQTKNRVRTQTPQTVLDRLLKSLAFINLKAQTFLKLNNIFSHNLSTVSGMHCCSFATLLCRYLDQTNWGEKVHFKMKQLLEREQHILGTLQELQGKKVFLFI